MSIDQKIAQLMEESEKLQAEESQEVVAEEATEEVTEEQVEVVAEEAKNEHTVDIDHTGERDENAAEHNIKLKVNKAKSQAYATGSKPNLQKYLAKHYDSHEDAKEMHPEVFKEETAKLAVDVSEDVAALVNGEELSEEFKTKAATIFEAAVVTRVKSEMAKLEEQFETQLNEQVEEIKNGLVEKVDGYLNYVVEQWMTDNEIALENGLKNEIMESFIAGMKNVFQEHYIEVPEEKFDILGDMQEEITVMKSKLDEQLASNVEMKTKLDEMVRTSSIEDVASEMVATDAEKFRGLAEELSFDDVETFKAKLQTIKENYFGQKQASTIVESVVTDEPVEQLDESVKPQVDPLMARYLTALKS